MLLTNVRVRLLIGESLRMGMHHKKKQPLGWKERLTQAQQWVMAEEGRPLQVAVGSAAVLVVVVLGVLWLLYG